VNETANRRLDDCAYAVAKIPPRTAAGAAQRTINGAGNGSASARSTLAGDTRQTAVNGGRLKSSAIASPNPIPRAIAQG